MILFDKIGWVLFHFIWQATAIAIISSLLLYVLKGVGSRVRYVICCFSLLLMIVLPVCFSFSNFIKDSYSFDGSAINQMSPVDTKEVFNNGSLIATQFRTSQIQISSYEDLIFYINRYTPLISIIWMIGVMLTTLYRIYGFSKIRSLVRQAQIVVNPSWEVKIKDLIKRISIKRVITILQSSSISTPAVIGFLKPVLLIPVSFFTGLETKYVEAILLHELAHIKRYDYLVNILQLIIETLGFFHPAVWWVSNRIRRERENCCDDFAVEILGDKLIYVKSLVQLEESRLSLSLISAANGSNLLHRISRLVGKKSNKKKSPLFNFAAASFVTLFLLATLGFAMINSNDGSLLNLFKNNSSSKLDENLAAYYPFNENAFDESLFKQKMFINNITLCEDRLGRKNSAVDFNGKDSYIRIKNDEVNNAESITICSWVNPRSAKKWESWISKDGPKWASAWRVGFGENKNYEWGFTRCNSISGQNMWADYWITNTEVPINNWTHVAVSADLDRKIVTVYMNGEKIGALKNLKPFYKSQNSIRIGYQPDDNVYFNGKIDDVRIYNRVLSDEEVRAVYEIE